MSSLPQNKHCFLTNHTFDHWQFQAGFVISLYHKLKLLYEIFCRLDSDASIVGMLAASIYLHHLQAVMGLETVFLKNSLLCQVFDIISLGGRWVVVLLVFLFFFWFFRLRYPGSLEFALGVLRAKFCVNVLPKECLLGLSNLSAFAGFGGWPDHHVFGIAKHEISW